MIEASLHHRLRLLLMFGLALVLNDEYVAVGLAWRGKLDERIEEVWKLLRCGCSASECAVDQHAGGLYFTYVNDLTIR
jgi:hypothetical protein